MSTIPQEKTVITVLTAVFHKTTYKKYRQNGTDFLIKNQQMRVKVLIPLSSQAHFFSASAHVCRLFTPSTPRRISQE